jgi:myo-inositol 2-dehydrogenase/D-chiro-inositol 1-dehydrogenase
MTSVVRFGLIGTGRIGQVHATNIAESADATLQWVCDPFIDGAAATAERFGGNVTTNARDVFAAGDVDAIVIASPTATHIDLIAASLDAGIPVLCEKPIDLDIRRAERLRERAAASGIPIALGFNRRFDPHFADLHSRVLRGDIGRLEQLSITSRDPAPPPADYIPVSGGIFRDMTIHDFDMARFFVPHIVAVSAHGSTVFSPEIERHGDFDSAVVVLHGAAGELVTITNSRHSAYGYDQRLEAFGSTGLVQVGNVGTTLVRRWGADSVEAQAPYLDFFLQRYAEAYRAELAAFVRAVNGEPFAGAGFEDGRAALVLADAAAASAATGATVVVDLG